jgi:hypothetical protein
LTACQKFRIHTLNFSTRKDPVQEIITRSHG